MSARRMLLIGLLTALGICATAGVFALGVSSTEVVWQILAGAIITAVACGTLLPVTLLTDRPKLRLGGLVTMGVIGLLWLECLGMVVISGRSWGGSYRWEEAIMMSFGVTLLMGIPSVGVALLISFKWARIAVVGFLGVVALSWIVCEFAALLSVLLPYRGSFGYEEIRWSEFMFLTGMILYGMGSCTCELLINSWCGDKRYFRWLGIAAALVAAFLFIVAVWMEPLGFGSETSQNIAKAAYQFMLVAMVMGHVNLLLMARLRQSQLWLQWLTMGMAILVSLVAAPLVFMEGLGDTMEVLARLVVACAIATGCGSVALIVLSMLNRKPAAALMPGALTATEVTFFCPRCQARQTLALGDAVCKNCELKISIKVIEPRCPACGYLLYQLTSARCPECGALVREGEAAAVGVGEPVASEVQLGPLGPIN